MRIGNVVAGLPPEGAVSVAPAVGRGFWKIGEFKKKKNEIEGKSPVSITNNNGERKRQSTVDK